jgi:cytochrome c oxidase subunit 4
MAENKEHVVSPKIYVAVLLTLMVLLVLTIVATFVDLDKLLGRGQQGTAYWNMAVAILIAICKAVLIILFFMHVKYSSKVTWAFATAGFVWLGILMTLSLSDYLSRNFPNGAPKSSPAWPESQYMRPAPRHEPVVPGAGAAPIRPELMPDAFKARSTET